MKAAFKLDQAIANTVSVFFISIMILSAIAN
jgi:hypothetical protein